MRNLSLSVSEFDKELESKFQGKFEKLTFLALGKKAYIPTQSVDIQTMEDCRWTIDINNPKKVRGFAIISWYIPNQLLGHTLRQTIKSRLSSSTLDFQERGRIFPLLESKELMLTYLVECDESMDARGWYGNYLPYLQYHLPKFLILMKIDKASLPAVEKYTGYCRGYKSSPGQDKLIHEQVLENNRFIETWQLLKQIRNKLNILNEQATQLWILREFEQYKLIKDELAYLSRSYQLLKDQFSMTESQIDNVIEAETLHRAEGIKTYKFN